MKVATGLTIGSSAKPELAGQAVSAAMAKADILAPSSVLLFLTSEFAADPQSAIKAAAKAASCTQIVGCSASGIFTEEDWVLDGAAAAAMVFSDEVNLTVADAHCMAPFTLTLAAPNAINSTWLNKPGGRFGGVSGDATGSGPFSVWQNSKGVTQGYCELEIHNVEMAVGASHGLKSLTKPQRITQTNGHDVLGIANSDALSSLIGAWEKQAGEKQFKTPPPYHKLVAMHASKATQFERNDYNIASIISGNEKNDSVTLTAALREGDWLCWAVRDTDAAQIDIVKTASELKQQLHTDPKFALLFSCLGRGPYFYDGTDQDLALIKALFPKLPIIGFYGNGEIAPIRGVNELLQYSAVLGLFANGTV